MVRGSLEAFGRALWTHLSPECFKIYNNLEDIGSLLVTQPFGRGAGMLDGRLGTPKDFSWQGQWGS